MSCFVQANGVHKQKQNRKWFIFSQHFLMNLVHVLCKRAACMARSSTGAARSCALRAPSLSAASTSASLIFAALCRMGDRADDTASNTALFRATLSGKRCEASPPTAVSRRSSEDTPGRATSSILAKTKKGENKKEEQTKRAKEKINLFKSEKTTKKTKQNKRCSSQGSQKSKKICFENKDSSLIRKKVTINQKKVPSLTRSSKLWTRKPKMFAVSWQKKETPNTLSLSCKFGTHVHNQKKLKKPLKMAKIKSFYACSWSSSISMPSQSNRRAWCHRPSKNNTVFFFFFPLLYTWLAVCHCLGNLGLEHVRLVVEKETPFFFAFAHFSGGMAQTHHTSFRTEKRFWPLEDRSSPARVECGRNVSCQFQMLQCKMWFTQLKRQKSTPATDPLPQAPNLRQKAKCRPPAARDTKATPVCSIPVSTASCPCSASCAAASSSEHCSQAAKQASCAGERNVKRRKEERTTKSNNKTRTKSNKAPRNTGCRKQDKAAFEKQWMQKEMIGFLFFFQKWKTDKRKQCVCTEKSSFRQNKQIDN